MMFPVQETLFLEQVYAYCLWLVRLTFLDEKKGFKEVASTIFQELGTRSSTETEGKLRTS